MEGFVCMRWSPLSDKNMTIKPPEKCQRDLNTPCQWFSSHNFSSQPRLSSKDSTVTATSTLSSSQSSTMKFSNTNLLLSASAVIATSPLIRGQVSWHAIGFSWPFGACLVHPPWFAFACTCHRISLTKLSLSSMFYVFVSSSPRPSFAHSLRLLPVPPHGL